MKTPIRLLVGLDLETIEEASLDFAKSLASRLDGEILLSHAVEHAPHDKGEEQDVRHNVDVHLAQRRDALRAEGLKAAALPAHVGRPHKVLREHAEDSDANAIVIGAGDCSMLERLFIGATAEKLVRTSQCPVFLRHPNDALDTDASILCALDCSNHSERVLANAVNLARLLNAELHILHVEQHLVLYPDIPDIPAYKVLPISHLEAAPMLDSFIARVDTSGVKVTPQIAIGPPASEIVATAKKLQPQLLVLGRHGHGGFIERLVGSVTMSILRTVPCSMLVIGDKDL
jgi:nucleotide-binding universal stress UspA family protein